MIFVRFISYHFKNVEMRSFQKKKTCKNEKPEKLDLFSTIFFPSTVIEVFCS